MCVAQTARHSKCGVCTSRMLVWPFVDESCREQCERLECGQSTEMIVFFGSAATVANLIFIRFAVCVYVFRFHALYDHTTHARVVHTQYGTRYKREQCIATKGRTLWRKRKRIMCDADFIVYTYSTEQNGKFMFSCCAVTPTVMYAKHNNKGNQIKIKLKKKPIYETRRLWITLER